jgi:hypothetical protein
MRHAPTLLALSLVTAMNAADVAGADAPIPDAVIAEAGTALVTKHGEKEATSPRSSGTCAAARTSTSARCCRSTGASPGSTPPRTCPRTCSRAASRSWLSSTFR